MSNKSQPGMVSQQSTAMTLMSLLAVICARNGHTFTWYTSKKARVWLTLKGFRPIEYSTSVEIASTVTDEQMFDAIKVLFATHWPKLTEAAPPLPTWIPTRGIGERLDSANKLVDELWTRWQAGEVFWSAGEGDPSDNAMLDGEGNEDQVELGHDR